MHIRLDAGGHAWDLCSDALQCRRHRAANSAGVHHENFIVLELYTSEQATGMIILSLSTEQLSRHRVGPDGLHLYILLQGCMVAAVHVSRDICANAAQVLDAQKAYLDSEATIGG